MIKGDPTTLFYPSWREKACPVREIAMSIVHTQKFNIILDVRKDTFATRFKYGEKDARISHNFGAHNCVQVALLYLDISKLGWGMLAIFCFDLI